MKEHNSLVSVNGQFNLRRVKYSMGQRRRASLVVELNGRGCRSFTIPCKNNFKMAQALPCQESIKLKVIFKPWYLDPQGLPDEGKVSKVVIGAVWLVLAFWSWAPSCILGLSSTDSELVRLCRLTWGLVLRAIYKTQLVTRVFF